MGSVQTRLSLAACTLIAAGGVQPGIAADSEPQAVWVVDTSHLYYSESDERVTVSKTLASLRREHDEGALSVTLVHDTMSGASPTGAIASGNSAVSYTSASGGETRSANGDYSLSAFDDTRIQAGLGVDRELSRGLTLSYGGAVSSESDYESYGANIALARDSSDKSITYSAGLAFTFDSIFRSDTGGTPEPLGNVQSERPYTEASRDTVDVLLGVSHVLNRQTLAQLNVSFGASNGYHSDPYKIISAAGDDERILANFHDSRPESRFRTSLNGKLVHQLSDSTNTIKLAYRLYLDDWGIQSHTADFRYRHQLSKRHYLEPHVRLYRQTEADFYQRKLAVDGGLNPVLPEDDLASADYRLDAMTSTTLGIKYGVRLTPKTELRLRAEYLDQIFSTADYGHGSAVIMQTSFKIRF